MNDLHDSIARSEHNGLTQPDTNVVIREVNGDGRAVREPPKNPYQLGEIIATAMRCPVAPLPGKEMRERGFPISKWSVRKLARYINMETHPHDQLVALALMRRRIEDVQSFMRIWQ